MKDQRVLADDRQYKTSQQISPPMGGFGPAFGLPSLVDPQAVVRSQKLFTSVLLYYPLRHLLCYRYPVTVPHLLQEVERQLPLRICEALENCPHSLVRQGFPFLVGLLGGKEVDQGGGGDVRGGACKSLDYSVVFFERLPPAIQLGRGSDGGDGYFIGVHFLEEVDEAVGGDPVEGFASGFGLGRDRLSHRFVCVNKINIILTSQKKYRPANQPFCSAEGGRTGRQEAGGQKSKYRQFHFRQFISSIRLRRSKEKQQCERSPAHAFSLRLAGPPGAGSMRWTRSPSPCSTRGGALSGRLTCPASESASSQRPVRIFSCSGPAPRCRTRHFLI